MQDADISSSEIVESTARNRYLSFAERLERLRDDDALGFTSDWKFLQSYWLGKRAMYLEIHSKIQDEYNCIEIIGILVERVQKIFGNRMIAIYNQGGLSGCLDIGACGGWDGSRRYIKLF